MITLASAGLKVGDIVTFASQKQSTGGVIFQVSMNFDSPIPKCDRRRGKKHEHPVTKKQLKPMEVEGYVRLKPLYTFFATSRGRKPIGAGETVLVYHCDLYRVKKVELLDVMTKYAELGNVIRDLAVKHGMVLEAPREADSAHS